MGVGVGVGVGVDGMVGVGGGVQIPVTSARPPAYGEVRAVGGVVVLVATVHGSLWGGWLLYVTYGQ